MGKDNTNTGIMAKPKRPGRPKQKLSPQAAAAKKARDERIAKSPARTKKKAENQRKRRQLAKEGVSLKGKDIHHSGSETSLISEHANRGNFGRGTKREHASAPRRHNID